MRERRKGERKREREVDKWVILKSHQVWVYTVHILVY